MTVKRTSKVMVLAREREHKAFEMRKEGKTYRQISEELGISPHGAYVMVKRVLLSLATLTAEDAKEVKRIQLERLDAMLKGLWFAAEHGDVHAVDRVIKIEQRRSELLGLDAPKQHEFTGKDGGPLEVRALTDAERAERVAAILDTARERRNRQSVKDGHAVVPTSRAAD